MVATILRSRGLCRRRDPRNRVRRGGKRSLKRLPGVTYSHQARRPAGKVLTSAGATAGIDLALTLLGLSHGPVVAQTAQLSLE